MTAVRELTISLTFLFSCIAMHARPVNREVVLRQPDGSSFRAIIAGDEYCHTVRDLHGHLIATDTEGWWCYSGFDSDGSRLMSGHRAGMEAPEEILLASLADAPVPAYSRQRRRLFERRTAMRLSAGPPAFSRKRHCAILLVEFADVKMEAPAEDFTRLITEKGYGRDGAVGSADDYFNDQFRGDVEFSYEISGILTLSGNMADYFGNDKNGNDKNAAAAVAEACQIAASGGFDFSGCDDDGDGEVDNVFLFVAGKDEADGGGDDCVWSHTYYLEYSPFKGLAFGGKVINTYAVSTEKRLCSDGEFRFTSIGTFCHEYSHSLGLMDMYDTDYAGSGGYGDGLWHSTALMDGGNTNGDCSVPPYYNAVDFDAVGLGNPEPLTCGKYELEPISRNRRFLKLESGNEGEYYLIECRDNSKWDRETGGQGLLIYHIDKSGNPAGFSDWTGRMATAAERWENNEINCRPERQCARLVSATPGIRAFDGRGNFMKNAGSVFFPCGKYDSFTQTTDPAFVFHDGSASPLALTDIVFRNGVASFTVTANTGNSVPEVILGNVDIFQDAAIIQWEADIPGYEGNATVRIYGPEGNEQECRTVGPYLPGKYALVLEGLKQSTPYKVTVSFRDGGLVSEERPVNFTTKRLYNGHPFIFLNNVDRNDDGSFKPGSGIPLRVYNANNVRQVRWFLDNAEIGAGPDGYYHVGASGRLKAVIRRNNGSEDLIIKEIIVKP